MGAKLACSTTFLFASETRAERATMFCFCCLCGSLQRLMTAHNVIYMYSTYHYSLSAYYDIDSSISYTPNYRPPSSEFGFRRRLTQLRAELLKNTYRPTLRPIAASPVHRLAAVRAMRNEQYYSLGNLLMLHRKGTEAGAFFSAARDNDPSPETQCLDQCGVPARLGKVAHPYALHAAFCCPLLS